MDADVDAYFAQHDVPSVISDMLFELGFHRPKEVGKFIASYIGRRFHIEGPIGSGPAARGNSADGKPLDRDYSTIEVHTAPATTGSDEALACSLVEEVRALRKKYKEFQPQAIGRNGAAPTEDATAFAMIPWAEFRTDYERLLVVLTSPQLWAFCERRLRMLRGLFDAHCALNAGVEESAAAASPVQVRVDNCVQLARALAPRRLMGLFRRNANDEATAGSEAVPGLSLDDLLGKLGHVPGPLDLTADADAPVPSAEGLCGVFSRTCNHVRGQFLAEATLESFKLLERAEEAGCVPAYAQYRLPLHPAGGAWTDLARWAAEFSVRSPRVTWVVQILQGAYGELQECRSVASFEELLENALGPPISASLSAADASEAPLSASAAQLSRLLAEVGAFELAATNGGADHLSPEADREPKDWTSPASPPYPYQLYHFWARLKALNACRQRADLEPMELYSAASAAEPLACGYLLGVNAASRCGALSAHPVLQYLFAIDGVVAMVSLASRRSLGGSGEAGVRAFSQLFRAGVSLALCTEDPTVSQQNDEALETEYCLARTMAGLTEADLAELAQNSVAVFNSSAVKGTAEPIFRSEGQEDQKGLEGRRSIRERYREGRRAAELELLARLAPRASAASHAMSHGGAGS